MARLINPPGRWNGRTVALDDGHGMETPGKRTPYIQEIGRQIKENEFNRKVVQYLTPILLDHGFRVLLVAPTNEDTPLSYRTRAANENKSDIYVSVHYNAFDGSFGGADPNGIELYVYPGYLNRSAGKLASSLAKYLRQGTDQNFRGIKEANFHVLRETDMPAVLTENGYMDNKREALLMIDESFQKEVAEEHARGILDYFGIPYKGGLDYLSLGDTGAEVKEMQENLLKLGYTMNGFGADGSFGPATEAAVKAFQKDQNLEVDGFYGPKTKAAMEKALEDLDKGEEEMEKLAVVINSFADFPAVEALAIRKNALIALRAVAEKRQVAEQIIVAGGGTDGLKGSNFIDLTGKTRLETSQNIKNYLSQ
ncbi:N-acetylmuramoyl-L-alanine amidase [Halobacillus litoralis]|uniref:N-acetylmuramoyl-L-alanine amidase n=1 Tax=Halobacillus litoralis TaxID=45668 RepID=A0A845DP48_9BACI|nr:N-acetylmuramoyl-L-alanine amidase [Halobacillus litoralis]MYL19280.1 N-acetylmuramoyl-L-alanine amidase [Halobacillus litoralis]MYL37642.1 N-acetylmuramoyl-L-alanine amidase [Halobacillus litoralis]